MQRIKLIAIAAGLVVIAAGVFAIWLVNGGPDSGGAAVPGPGSTTTPNVVRPGAPGASSSTIAPGDPGATETVAPTQADVDFVEGMIHHHQQALTMADYLPSRGTDANLRVFARRLRIGQDSEIKQMEQWLQTYRAPTSEHTGHDEHSALMPGMLTAAELQQLESSRGATFDRLFLQYMIRHHQGALTMIKQLYAAGGGAQSDLDLLVRHIDTDQTTEINRMRQMLSGS